MNCNPCSHHPLGGISHQRDNISPGAVRVFKNRKSKPVTKAGEKVKQVCGRTFPRCYFASRELIDGSAIIVTVIRSCKHSLLGGDVGCPRVTARD